LAVLTEVTGKIMKSSKFTPKIIYINTPDSVLFPVMPDDIVSKGIVLGALCELEIPYIMYTQVIVAANIVMNETKQSLPHGGGSMTLTSKADRNAINIARDKFVSSILQSITIDFSNGVAKYIFDGRDISREVTNVSIIRDLDYQTWVNGINHHLSVILTGDHQHMVAIVATDPRRLTEDRVNPIVGILAPGADTPDSRGGRALRLRKKVDAIFTLSDVESLCGDIASIIDEFTDLRTQADQLRVSIDDRRIKLEPQFQRDTWPSYALIAYLKSTVREIVQDVISRGNEVCDPLDLEYQTLFRLTSLPITSVFDNGDELDAYLREHGAYDYWRNILTLDPTRVTYPVKVDVVEAIVNEQLLIIRDRLRKATLPTADITQRQGIFAEQGWKLQKYAGALHAIKVDTESGNDTIIDKKRVTFKPIDVEYAKQLHAVFHYIHTPRAVRAFGLFLEDSETPFSVVAFDVIDRSYKKDLLFMLGYDPNKCFDLARLYSKPGTPFNTSSTISTLAFTYFREHEPEVQAVLSAFMPTYAHGMSMISAGFNYGSLVKEWRHSFVKREIDGRVAWELATKRRIDGTQETIESQWPLLPVFELVAELQIPRFTPFDELNGHMVSRNL
jgi:hypothetical protein